MYVVYSCRSRNTKYQRQITRTCHTVHKGYYIDSSPGFIPYIIVLQNDSHLYVLRKFKAGVLLEKNVRKTYPPLLLSNGFSEGGLYDFCRTFFVSFNLKQAITPPKNVLFLANLFGQKLNLFLLLFPLELACFFYHMALKSSEQLSKKK